MAYAEASDIQARLGRELEDFEATIVETRLDDAEELLMIRIPDLDGKVASGTIRERLVVMVECEAVLRLIRNIDGYTDETDGNYSYTIDASVASGRLSIEPEEWTMLGLGSKIGVLSPKIILPDCEEGRGWWNDPNRPFNQGQYPQPANDTAVWG